MRRSLFLMIGIHLSLEPAHLVLGGDSLGKEMMRRNAFMSTS
jgi:hypothetical protein